MAGMLLMGMYWYVFRSDACLFDIRTRVAKNVYGTEILFHVSGVWLEEAMLIPDRV